MSKGPETDSAETELPDITPWPSADIASVVGPYPELGWSLMLLNQTLFCHLMLLSASERHPKVLQQCLSFLIGLGSGTYGDVKAVHHVHLVIIYLREDVLLLYTH